jgi:hypothetical protein
MSQLSPEPFIEEFQNDERIDPAKLDVECLRQPELSFKWAQRSAKALATRDRLKSKRDVVAARLELECRKNPEEFGLAKITESAVTATIKCHPDYIAADDEYNDAQEMKNVMDAAARKMNSREGMLRMLIELYKMEYFAGPTVPHDLIADWTEYKENESKSITKQQKRRTRKRRDK